MENQENMGFEEKGPEVKTGREVMTMKDGTIADVTDMSPEERRNLIEEYNN